jgi:hypothetical protein
MKGPPRLRWNNTGASANLLRHSKKGLFMALRFKVTKAQYDKLSPEFQNEYIAGDKEGEFVLDVSELPQGEDVGPVKRALEAERAAHKATKTSLSEAQSKIEAFPDVETIKADAAKENAKLKTFAEKTLINAKATELATKISTVPALMAKEIASRLTVDMTGDEPVTKVLGKDGKPTDMTIEKLGEEFVANPELKAIVKASNGTGGGMPTVSTVKPLGGGMPTKDGEQKSEAVDLSKLDGKSLAAKIQARKEAAAEGAQQQPQA